MALTDQLVSYWKLDGNGNDSAGSTPFTAQGSGFTYTAAKINTGVRLFLVQGNYMTSTASSSFSSASYSISFWMSGATLGGSVYFIFSKAHTSPTQNGYGIYSTSSGKIFLEHFGVGSIQSTSTLSTNTFYHVVMTYASGTGKIYINGTLDKSASLSAFSTPTNSQFLGSDEGGSNTWDGIIDEIGYWSRELTSTEVTSLYNTGSGISYPFGGVNSGFLTFM